MKKLLGLIAVTATATVALTACGEKVTPNVVVVTAEGSINDGTFNQGAYNGVKASNLLYGTVTEGHYEAKSGDAAVLATAIQNQLDNGAETVVLPGYTHGTKNLTDLAKLEKNKGKKFILIDSTGTKGTTGDETFQALDNAASALYAIEQAAYLTGFMTQLHLSGTTQKEVKYGIWGGMAFPSVYSFMAGFKQGAEEAATIHGGIAKANFLKPKTGAIHTDYYAGNFDQGGGKTIADAYLNQGADVLLPVAGPQTKDAIDAIKGKSNSTAKVIGVDVDATALYKNDEAYILTSIMKNIAKTVADILQPVYGFGGTSYFGATGYVGTLYNGGIGYKAIKGFDVTVDPFKAAYTKANVATGAKTYADEDFKACDTTYAETC